MPPTVKKYGSLLKTLKKMSKVVFEKITVYVFIAFQKFSESS